MENTTEEEIKAEETKPEEAKIENGELVMEEANFTPDKFPKYLPIIIESDGTRKGTKLMDTAGNLIGLIQSVKWEIGLNDPYAKAVIHLYKVPVRVVAKGKLKYHAFKFPRFTNPEAKLAATEQAVAPTEENDTSTKEG